MPNDENGTLSLRFSRILDFSSLIAAITGVCTVVFFIFNVLDTMDKQMALDSGRLDMIVAAGKVTIDSLDDRQKRTEKDLTDLKAYVRSEINKQKEFNLDHIKGHH